MTARDDLLSWVRVGMRAHRVDGPGSAFTAEDVLARFVEEVQVPVIEALLDRAVSAYRMRDKLLNDESRAHERALSVGEMVAYRESLCIVQGWDPNEHGDKEGRADEMVIARWQERYPEEWA